MGPFGIIWGVPGLPWAAQVRKKMQNLVRGSPKGSPKGGQKGPKSDQNEVQSRKNEGRGPKRRKTEAEVRFWTFFCGLWAEKSQKYKKREQLETLYTRGDAAESRLFQR